LLQYCVDYCLTQPENLGGQVYLGQGWTVRLKRVLELIDPFPKLFVLPVSILKSFSASFPLANNHIGDSGMRHEMNISGMWKIKVANVSSRHPRNQ